MNGVRRVAARVREWAVRLYETFRPGRREADLEEELKLHLELAAEEARLRGELEPERAAAIRLGGLAQAMEALRDQRGIPWLRDLARDVSVSARMLRKNGAFTVAAVLSLAMGLGASSAIFSYADALLLRPLPVPHPGNVVTVGSTSSSGRPPLVASYREFLDLKSEVESFEGLLAYTTTAAALNSRPHSPPRAAIGMLVTGDFFRVLDLEPSLGRAFLPEEAAAPGGDAVVVLGHEFWEQEFGADPSILGRSVRLNGLEFVVVGVGPRGFPGLDPYTRFQFYVPLTMWARLSNDPTDRFFEARGFRALTVKGRLAPGVSLEEARSEVHRISANLERAHPEANRDRLPAVLSELEARVGNSPSLATQIGLLSVLAGAVLFVAGANVAGLLASRAPTRAREIALRLALGSGRFRVARQLVTESVLLAAIGCVLGLGVAYVGVVLFRRFRIPTELPIAVSFELDGRVFLVSLVLALASALLFGLGPALRSTRIDWTGATRVTEGDGLARPSFCRTALVGGQVAMSVILLVVATIAHRGVRETLDTGPGFRTDGVLLMWFQPALLRYSEPEAQRFFEELIEKARVLPGVESAALASYVPMDGGVSRVEVVPEGYSFPQGSEAVQVPSAVVDEQYFETLRIPIVSGRPFRSLDSVDAPPVAVVNEELARRFWPRGDAVGKRFRLKEEPSWIEIVGVARTSRYVSIGEPPTDFVYFPFRQRPRPLMALLAGTSGDPASLVTPLRSVVSSLDANQPIFNVRTMSENYRMRQLVIADAIARLIVSLGIVALTLAFVGLYGLVAYGVGRRTREIGVRMAIGARPSQVVGMVLRAGVATSLVGLGVGLLASLAVAPTLSAAVPGALRHGEIDVGSLLLVVATVLSISLLAAYVPGRRAASVDPTEALRCE